MSIIKSTATDMGMLTEAEGVCSTFEKALSNFAKCHQGYSGGAMDDKAIDQLGGSIGKVYDNFYNTFIVCFL